MAVMVLRYRLVRRSLGEGGCEGARVRRCEGARVEGSREDGTWAGGFLTRRSTSAEAFSPGKAGDLIHARELPGEDLIRVTRTGELVRETEPLLRIAASVTVRVIPPREAAEHAAQLVEGEVARQIPTKRF